MAQKLPCGTTFDFYEKTHPGLAGSTLNELDKRIAGSIARKGLQKVQNNANEVLRVPVVFHIIHRSFVPVGKGENYSDIVILDILKNINDAFRKKAGTYWDGDGADAKIEFCLASIDPDGKNTSGIVRVNGSVIQQFDSIGIYFNRPVSPHFDDVRKLSWWNYERYVNIYIVHEIIGAGGFSSQSGVVISMSLRLESMDYDTYIHELGHHLSLYHIFQDSCSETDCKAQGDRVCDTPPTKIGNIANGYCEGAPSCGTDQISLVRNYMDYGLLACHNMFTLGQVERMRASLDTTITTDKRSKLTTVGNLIATGCYGTMLPRSLFLADRSMSCIEDTVTFRNFSQNATSYLWKFENARPGTSAQKEPKVIFCKAGDHKVSLISTSDKGSSQLDTVFHVEGIASPIVTGSLLDAGNQHTLSAMSTYNLDWYDADTSTAVIATGATYVTPLLSRSKVYFVQAFGSGTEKSVGMAVTQFPNTGSNDGNVYFTVYKPLLIKSIKVFAQKRKFKFHLRDKNALILREFTVDGENIPYDSMVLELNIQLSPGCYYFDQYYNHDPENFWIYSLGIDPEGAQFPYKIVGLISIDSTNRPPEYYHFYYDWKVEEVVCRSERVPVIASVKGDANIRTDVPAKRTITSLESVKSQGHALNVTFNLSAPQPVTIGIFTMSGNRVRKVDLKRTSAGTTLYTVNTAALASGRYILEMKTGAERYRADFVKR